jgi:hypothetical protein
MQPIPQRASKERDSAGRHARGRKGWGQHMLRPRSGLKRLDLAGVTARRMKSDPKIPHLIKSRRSTIIGSHEPRSRRTERSMNKALEWEKRCWYASPGAQRWWVGFPLKVTESTYSPSMSRCLTKNVPLSPPASVSICSTTSRRSDFGCSHDAGIDIKRFPNRK